MALTIVTGPPAAGKSTWVAQHAKAGDIVIDYDRLANALTVGADTHDHTDPVRSVALEARAAAITRALRYAGRVDVYVIHTSIPVPAMALYRRHKAKVVIVDPGPEVVFARCEAERPDWALPIAKQWYARHRKAAG